MDIGNTVIMACVATGFPTPSISWAMEVTELYNDSRVTIYDEILEEGGVIFTRSILEICSLTVEDGGQYSCTASNPGSDDTVNFVLTINIEPPILVVTSDDTTVTSGSSVLLTCVGYGLPQPDFEWKRRTGNIVTEIENTETSNITTTTIVVDEVEFVQSTLLLCANQLNTTAEYTCIAFNSGGSANDSFIVSIEFEGSYLDH